MELLALVINLLLANPQYTNLYNDVVNTQETITQQELNDIYNFIICEETE